MGEGMYESYSMTYSDASNVQLWTIVMNRLPSVKNYILVPFAVET